VKVLCSEGSEQPEALTEAHRNSGRASSFPIPLALRSAPARRRASDIVSCPAHTVSDMVIRRACGLRSVVRLAALAARASAAGVDRHFPVSRPPGATDASPPPTIA
jgi:hypothetical protein